MIKMRVKTRSAKLSVTASPVKMAATTGKIAYVGGELYDGEYAVTPRVTEQTLPTAQKLMLEDLTVRAIPRYDVSNTSGGTTIFIANEV